MVCKSRLNSINFKLGKLCYNNGSKTGHNPNDDFHHQYQYRPQSNSNNMGTLDFNLSFITQTTPMTPNNNNKSVTVAPTTKKFQLPSVLLLEPKPIGPTPTPSLIINNNNKTMDHQQVIVSTGATTTTTKRVPPSPLARGMVPSEVSDEIDDGIAQAFTEEDVNNGNDDVELDLDVSLEDWTKVAVYEGDHIDICGGTDHDLNLNQSEIRMINDDPIPLISAAASLTAVVGSPTKHTLSLSLSLSHSQFQLHQQVPQQQQRIQQLQQRVQHEQQRRAQQQQQHFTHHVPPPIDRVTPPP